MTKGLYICTLIVFLIVFIVILISVIKSKKKKRMYKALDELEKEKNLLINVPVLSELSKVEALIKNNKLEEKYNAWKLKFDIIEKETITKEQIDELVRTGKIVDDKFEISDEPTLSKLRHEAKTLKIKGYTKMTKEELESAIKESEDKKIG